MAKIKSESISTQHQKRKKFLVVAAIAVILSLIIASFFSFYNENSEAFAKKKADETVAVAEKDRDAIAKGEFKESWAISVDSRLSKVAQTLAEGISSNEESFRKELSKQNDKLDEFLIRVQEMNNQRDKAAEVQIQELKGSIIALNKTTDEKVSRMNADWKRFSSELKNQAANPNENSGQHVAGNVEKGNLMLPPLDSDPSSANPMLPQLGGGVSNSIAVGTEAPGMRLSGGQQIGVKPAIEVEQPKEYFVEDIVNENVVAVFKNEDNKTIEPEKEIEYEIATGFTDAFMVTGAYAPIFGETTDEASIPVLLETQGDMIIANDNTQSIDKCFLIGGAIGNPSSDTVDIRLSKIECIIGDGKKKIRGDIKGWVIGEDGKPGVKGELIHKSGQYISRFIMAGFLETLSSAAVSASQPVGGANQQAGASTILTNGAVEGGATGLNNAFSRLADFYIQLAEKTLPMIEAKGGRTVSVMFTGGNIYKVQDFNRLDVDSLMDEYLDSTGELNYGN